MGDFDPTDYGGEGGDELANDLLGLDAEDGENGEPGEVALKDALLFVIDCSFKGVLEPLKPGGRPALSEVLASAASVLKTKVITSPDDRVGIVVYGVREKNNPNSFEGIRVIQELDRPNAQRIKQLQQEVGRTAEQFEERYGMNRHMPVSVPLSDVFWTCTTIFNLNANPKRYQPRMFLFTGSEVPCNTEAEQASAETRAKDLLDLGVEVEFFPMIPAGSSFSIERFWGRVLPVESDDYVSQAAIRVETLERRIRRRVHRKRVLNRLNFELCPGTEVSVGIYVNTIQAKIPQHVYLLNENNKLLKSDRKSLCEQTASILHPVDDVETYVQVAGTRVFVSRAEMNEARNFGDPGVKLLGFKSASKLQPHHRIFHSYFVSPNEKDIKGSSGLCATLIQSMIERKLMAVVRYIPRKNSIPFLAALLPQAESDDQADQVCPPGFQMILLPFADEIRRLEFSAPEGASISQDMIDRGRDVVNALRIDGFTPGCVENPALQRHYAAVQALALGEDQPEETTDVLQPDAAALAEKAPVLSAWQSVVETNIAATAKRQRATPRESLMSPGGTVGIMRDAGAAAESMAYPRRTVGIMRDDGAALESMAYPRRTGGIMRDEGAALELESMAYPRSSFSNVQGAASIGVAPEMFGMSPGMTPDMMRASPGITPSMSYGFGGMEDSESRAKRPRAGRMDQQELTPQMMRNMVATGEVERLTVSQLKDYLKIQGIINTGKKGDLVERVRALY